MRGVFDDGEPEPVPRQRDTELTLGPVLLLGIFFGLVLICGLFFGLGYAVGRHGSPEPSALLQPAASSQTTLPADSSRPTPSATAQAGTVPAPQGAGTDQPPAANPGSNGAASSQSSEPSAATGSSSGQPQVRPALDPAANALQPAQPPAASKVEPALAPSLSLMVQIAAVSQQEDADVLAGALRKHGYAVTARQEAADGLIHVRIGPFSGRDEAERWRQKLLNDGYNAIVQP